MIPLLIQRPSPVPLASLVLKNGVNLMGASQAGVIINGTVSTPANFDNTTVSNLTVHNVGNGMLLDMTGTAEITSSNGVFNLARNDARDQNSGE